MDKILFIYLLISSILCVEIPVNQSLLRNESTSIDFNVPSSGEYIINVSAYSNTDWSQEGNESATLKVVIDGNQSEYNQDIIVFNGNTLFTYKCMLGYLNSGEHSIQIYFDYNKSSLDSEYIYIEKIEILNSGDFVNTDSDVFLYSPILYGRNIIAWNESSYTDIPIYMYYDIAYNEQHKIITYYLIFSNEDSRVGFGLSELMRAYGRTTDIEWIYRVTIDSENNIIDEVFQGASHITESFNGDKYFNHPILINATLNCNFSDYGTSDYRFFLNPANSYPEGYSSQILMDQNSWMYEIMAKELINENRYESSPNPMTWDLSDVRNYIYIEFEGNLQGDLEELKVGVQLYNDCNIYYNDHNEENIISNFYGGISRTAIELPANFNVDDIARIVFSSEGGSDYQLEIIDIKKIFYLNQDYNPIDLVYEDFSNLQLNYELNHQNIIINQDNLNLDCLGILYGEALCDNCGICSGGETGIEPNANQDDCGICYGNNEDMDCLGECFGNAYEDACGTCDNDLENDGMECDAGCTDSNANNYNSDSIIDDGSCEYDDNIFNVPEEYQLIQEAIYYSSYGDTVLVDSGTYNESIDFLGKDISVISLNGPDNTIINGSLDSTSVVTFSNGGNALFDGFTITGGYGKGISFEDFISNAADSDIFENMLYNDMASGGILCIESSPHLNNLIIENNFSRNVAGGIGIINSSPIISNSIIRYNTILDGDALGGGGIAINGGSPILYNLEIYNNTVGSNMYSLSGGGGILCGFPYQGNTINLLADNIEIYQNAANIGGGLGILSGEATLDRVLSINNLGDYGSSISLGEPLGLVIDDIDVKISKSTIAYNQGLISIGMIDNSNLSVINSIIWNPDAEYEIAPLPNNSQLNSQIFYSNIYSSYDGEGNISLNPDFDDIYNLNEGSPCIDAGISYFNYNGNLIIETDEYYGLNPDMGFYESDYEQILYGDINQDSFLDILDIVLIVDFIIENSIPNNMQFLLSDIDANGILDILDVIQLINIILNT